MDVDHTQKISLENLKTILGTAYSDEEIAAMIKDVDKLGDNQISMTEFEAAMRDSASPAVAPGPIVEEKSSETTEPIVEEKSSETKAANDE